jgi:glycosyltransferase involved in cell wall biosynthesis
MNQQPTTKKLTLCMIVRNEEARLADCLESVKDAVDEILIVDTGSTDRTVEIAESFGARIGRFEWNDDFSAARNFAIENATGDWILQIDADEKLHPDSIPHIRGFMENDEIDAVFIAIHNHERTSAGEPRIVVHPYPRLFRRREDIRYQGIVHEFLTNLNATVFTALRIDHYGYDCTPEEQKKRRARNEQLCLRQIQRDPNNAVAHFNLSGVYLGEQNIDAAQRHLERAIDLIDPKDSRYQHFYLMGLHYLAGIYGTKGQADRAVQYCQEAMRIRPDYLDPVFMLGEIQFRAGNFEAAESAFKGYLDLRNHLAQKPAKALFSQSRFNSHDHVHMRLGTLYQSRGDANRAEQHYQEAIRANPNSIGANLQLARLYTQRMDPGKAKEFLATAQRLQQAAEAN